MTLPQALAFGVIALMMIAFVVEKLRYDLVAVLSLLIAVGVGIVPFEKAFSGFSDDIVIIVASALIVSAGVARSGVVDLAIKRFFPNLSSFHAQLALLVGVVTILSAFIKNIGALAIMMPVAFQFAKKSGRSPSRYLMPMAFAALLGGLMTQIGTSPNIVVSRLRAEFGGEPFTMFDFTPVGAILAGIGFLFLLLFNRLVPTRTAQGGSLNETLENETYSAEAIVAEQSPMNGRELREVLSLGDGEVIATGVLRGVSRRAPFPDLTLKAGDTLLLEGPPAALDRLVAGARLTIPAANASGQASPAGDLAAIEVSVSVNSGLIGVSAREIALLNNYGISLLAINRQGQRLSDRTADITIRAGDLLLLQGTRRSLPGFLQDFGLLPLAERAILLGTPRNVWVPLAILGLAMIVTAFGWVPVPVAFFAAAVMMVVFRELPLADVYKSVDGPILVMLAALIPVSDSLRTTGATDLIAHWLGSVASGLPAYGALAILLVTTMAVTPFLNNAATVLVMGPIAASFATELDYRPEAFLMAVAIGAACDFLTPIGHQCNTLVMGPGGYRFSDYARLGLPLSLMISAASIPALLWVWPIH
ncbi:SLC13 family permease [Gellertiella hungarica]|uniref:Di/tricarboxylate transporter n=1 Tax=Gellertiella hungarica TaxID=1572859 RepID=A0A7W6J1H4_9HYPH|nr:SLC13 family permease [Gellertiella hungarica]MBB4062997.1 di/tricarboxylate transporter [Gellertiella hungarica]